MSGADERCESLALRCEVRLVEGDTLVAWQYRLAEANQPVPVPHWGGYVCDLEAVLLTRARGAAELLERLQEERFDVVRLEPLGVSSLHFLAHFGDAARVH